MKWTVKLVAEIGQGEALEREIATIEREDQVGPPSIGLTIAEGKNIMEGLQRELVTAQMERHGAAIPSCPQCKKSFSDKGLLPVHSAVRIWKDPDARSADQGLLLFGITSAHVFHAVHQ